MIAWLWVRGLFRRRGAQTAGAAAGVALAVGLLASLGSFLMTAKADMARRAISQVPVDWQVEVQPGTSPSDALAAMRRRREVRAVVPVGFAATGGFTATVAGSAQSTGPGVAVGVPGSYRTLFPREMRTLAGASQGVLVAQQTAANLHVGPGDELSVLRRDGTPTSLRVDGVIDLPAADSLFQRVGAPAGAQATAPPDNVIVLPSEVWQSVFSSDASARTQLHARVSHALARDPAAAFSQATASAHRLEADLSGGGIVGNNLAAALDAARSDAAYAQVLFVLLGLPGAVLAGLLTRAIAVANADQRRHDATLLRARGATRATLTRLLIAEGASIAAVGSVAGIALGAAAGRFLLGSAGRHFGLSIQWALVSVAAGIAVTVASVVVPGLRLAATANVAAARRAVGRVGKPLALRLYLDAGLLVGAATIFWASSRAHYALVLAPEGVPTVSVNYWALAGPLLLWAGLGALAWRAVDTLLGRPRPALRALLAPIAGSLRGPAASALTRNRRSLTTGIVLVALTGTFAISTAVFNTTYRNQVAVDALLTNGAPVTATVRPGALGVRDETLRLAAVPGAGHVEPVQHRFVYVGADLQDLYGVNAATIGRAGKLQDGYFSGGSAKELMARLRKQPDAALVSAETARDFQLSLGDRLNLRVRAAGSGVLQAVTFRYVGVVKEFPTAPTDSFVVANAAYLAQQTKDPTPSTYLIATRGGAAPRVVAARVRRAVGATAAVSDIDTSRRVVGSSLTAVNLSGLTHIELGFALMLVLATFGLVLGLGLAQRKRAFAIISAIGARRDQLAVFARAEAAAFSLLGGILGVVGGWALANMLTKVLTGVFDPPPATLSVPWRYLCILAACAALGVAGALRAQHLSLRRPLTELVRDL